MNYPLISVLMPAYNTELYIKEALNSIMATQYPNLDIIVINDGSTDNTAQIVADYPAPIRLYHQENKGIPITRNRTLSLMKGDIFTFLDADDVWTPYKFDVQLPLLQSADVVLGKSKLYSNKQQWVSMLLSSGLYHRRVLDKVPSFNETLAIGEDSDWIYRIWEAGYHIVHHDNIVHTYRRHDNNITYDQEAVIKVSIRMIKRSLDRRRKLDDLKQGRLLSNFVATQSDAELIEIRSINDTPFD